MHNPTRYTLGEAAKVTGKNKSTIQRAIKEGKLSATRKEDGSYSIDPVELSRMYPLVHLDDSATGSATGSMQHGATPRNPSTQPPDVAVLEERLRSREEKIHDLEQQLRDVEEQRDQWHAQAERLTLLLMAPQPLVNAVPEIDVTHAQVASGSLERPGVNDEELSGKRKSFWRRLLGK